MKVYRRLVPVVLVVLLAISVAALAQGQRTPSCTIFVQPGASIQAAIDNAPAGAVICLGKGIWNENIKITKSLTLKGAGQDQTIIKGKEEGPVVWIATPVAIPEGGTQTVSVEVEGPLAWITPPAAMPEGGTQTVSVKIEGLKITGAYGSCADLGGWGCPDSVLIQGSTQATISDSTISGNRGEGIVLADTVQATISRSTISENDDGIWISDSAQAAISNSVIFGNNCGVSLSDSARTTISGSTISGNKEGGINLGDTARATISNSAIFKIESVGIGLWDSAQAMILDSTISENIEGITLEDSAQTTISHSTVSENDVGIGLWDSAQAVIEANKIVKNEGYGVALYQQPCADTTAVFAGRVSGKGNFIPGPGNPDGNEIGAVCPQELAFLTSAQGGEPNRQR